MSRSDPGAPPPEPPSAAPPPGTRPAGRPGPFASAPRTAGDDAPLPAPPGARALFTGFLLIGISGFGGVLPIARRALVERRRWLTPEQFAADLGVAQLLPGPNIVNLSVAIGMRFAGLPGALAAIVGLVALPFVVLLALLALYARGGHLPVVTGALQGVSAVAAGLVAAMAWRMAVPLHRHAGELAIAAGTLLAIALLRWPLVPVLAVGGMLGLLLAMRRRSHG